MSRRFQFSLRALLVALTVTCLWLGSRVDLAITQRDAITQLSAGTGRRRVIVRDEGHLYHFFHATTVFVTYEKKSPDWLDEIVGRDFFNGVVALELSGDDISDVDLVQAARIHRLRLLSIRELGMQQITAAGIARFRRERQDVRLVSALEEE